MRIALPLSPSCAPARRFSAIVPSSRQITAPVRFAARKPNPHAAEEFFEALSDVVLLSITSVQAGFAMVYALVSLLLSEVKAQLAKLNPFAGKDPQKSPSAA